MREHGRQLVVEGVAVTWPPLPVDEWLRRVDAGERLRLLARRGPHYDVTLARSAGWYVLAEAAASSAASEGRRTSANGWRPSTRRRTPSRGSSRTRTGCTTRSSSRGSRCGSATTTRIIRGT